NIVLLGDFNSGCSYVTASDWQKIRLFTDKSFHWLIPDSADTTVTNTNCPYDRVVVTADMLKGVVHGSAQVYDFVADLNLSQNMVKTSPLEGLAVSDHFPVEAFLCFSISIYMRSDFWMDSLVMKLTKFWMSASLLVLSLSIVGFLIMDLVICLACSAGEQKNS
ncbi:Deoxyribonuclease-1, partial [Goodea atripinnis]